MTFPIIPSNLPEELVTRKQWVCWKYVKRDDATKPTKVPHTPWGYRADVTDPANWSTFADVSKAVARPGFDGIGFVFSPDDPYTGLDIDGLWAGDGDEGSEVMLRLLARFADSYSETSPSECGVKVWIRGEPPRCGRWSLGRGCVEIYSSRRFFTVTTRSAGVKVIVDHQDDLTKLVSNLDQDRHSPYNTPARVISGVIPKGQRHPKLVSLAGSMWRRNMLPEAIEAALLETNQRQCDPPYPPEHIRKIIDSMGRWKR
jgi:hypothetical protein